MWVTAPKAAAFVGLGPGAPDGGGRGVSADLSAPAGQGGARGAQRSLDVASSFLLHALIVTWGEGRAGSRRPAGSPGEAVTRWGAEACTSSTGRDELVPHRHQHTETHGGFTSLSTRRFPL